MPTANIVHRWLANNEGHVCVYAMCVHSELDLNDYKCGPNVTARSCWWFFFFFFLVFVFFSVVAKTDVARGSLSDSVSPLLSACSQMAGPVHLSGMTYSRPIQYIYYIQAYTRAIGLYISKTAPKCQNNRVRI